MLRKISLFLSLIAIVAASCACSSKQAQTPQPPQNVKKLDDVSFIGLINGEQKPPSAEVVKNDLKVKGNNWLYGYGFGKTLLNVGTAIVFPPYSIFLLGNAGLQLAGFERVDLIKALPQKMTKPVTIAYDEVTSVPGRFATAIARERFREKPIKATLPQDTTIPIKGHKALREEDLIF